MSQHCTLTACPGSSSDRRLYRLVSHKKESPPSRRHRIKRKRHGFTVRIQNGNTGYKLEQQHQSGGKNLKTSRQITWVSCARIKGHRPSSRRDEGRTYQRRAAKRHIDATTPGRHSTGVCARVPDTGPINRTPSSNSDTTGYHIGRVVPHQWHPGSLYRDLVLRFRAPGSASGLDARTSLPGG